MANPALTARMKDYFTRQIGWFEQLLADLAHLQGPPDGAMAARLSEQTPGHVKGTETLEREFWALLREWEAATDVSDDERAEVAALAQRAEGLAQELSEMYQRGSDLVGERLDALKETLLQLGRGRSFLRKYRVDGPTNTAYIDKKA